MREDGYTTLRRTLLPGLRISVAKLGQGEDHQRGLCKGGATRQRKSKWDQRTGLHVSHVFEY